LQCEEFGNEDVTEEQREAMAAAIRGKRRTDWFPEWRACGATCITREAVLSGMATEEAPEETKVSDRGMVTIPASLRRRLDIEAGDKLRWDVDDEGNISVTVVKQRYGAFDDFEPVSMGGGGSETHDLAGHEDDPAFSETN
jgi:antitoxin PrlF